MIRIRRSVTSFNQHSRIGKMVFWRRRRWWWRLQRRRLYNFFQTSKSFNGLHFQCRLDCIIHVYGSSSIHKNGAKIKKPKEENEEKNMHSLDLSNINFVLQVCTWTLNIAIGSLFSACMYVYLLIHICEFPGRVVDWRTNWHAISLKKNARIKFQLHWHMQHALQVRTHQRLFRQMIVSSDAINQRRKIKSPTFEFESVRIVWVGLADILKCCYRLCENCEEKSLASLVHTFHFAAFTSPNSRRTVSRSFQSLDGSYNRLVVCCSCCCCWCAHVCVCVFLSNYGNTNWIFISEFHVFHWTCCWFMF